MNIREIESGELRAEAARLRAEGYDFLFDAVGVDDGPGGALGVIYHVGRSGNPADMVSLRVVAEGDREHPVIPTVSDVWEVAQVYEREIHDFFGIHFHGNPDLRRLFLRGDWNGFPLRKDYDASPHMNPVPRTDETFHSMDSVPQEPAPGDEGARDDEGRTWKMLYEGGEYIVNFGPQHPAMHGVLHLRVSLDGEVVKTVDPHFGYIHRGIEKMCEGYTYPQILHLTERLDYLSGAINRHGFCLLCEHALEMNVPHRAVVVRTIFDELTRIASHLLGWGSMCMDMGAVTAFIYAMRDREKIMEIFEETAGGRFMTGYSTIGGVARDIHPGFRKRVAEFVPYMRKMLREHHLLFTGNPIARGRMHGVGFLSREKAIALGVTGPAGRASGWYNDIRKTVRYGAYNDVEFESVLRHGGGTFDRYMIRLEEIEQSLKIIEQLVDAIPEGPWAEKTKAVIKLPEGEYFQRVENARGQFGIHVTSRGEKNPWRVKFRSPSMTLVGALKEVAPTHMVADLIMLGGSLDYVIPCIDR
jgi:NADH-quinone oxidoreductase subunit C/D